MPLTILYEMRDAL